MGLRRCGGINSGWNRVGGSLGLVSKSNSPRRRGSTVFDPEAQTRRELTEVRGRCGRELTPDPKTSGRGRPGSGLLREV
jgi:hypothetical protein